MGVIKWLDKKIRDWNIDEDFLIFDSSLGRIHRPGLSLFWLGQVGGSPDLKWFINQSITISMWDRQPLPRSAESRFVNIHGCASHIEIDGVSQLSILGTVLNYSRNAWMDCIDWTTAESPIVREAMPWRNRAAFCLRLVGQDAWLSFQPPHPRPLEDLADNKPLEERYEGDLVTGLSLITY